MRRAALALLAFVLVAGCSPVAVPPSPPLSEPELKYRVFDEIGRPWYCDPDFYPVAHGDEKEIAVQRFPDVQRDAATYQVILMHLGLAAAVTDEQKLGAYREWKQLNALQLKRVNDQAYGFTYRVMRRPNLLSGAIVDGRIAPDGRITIIHEEAAGQPNCPICLADDVRIATPSGEILVTDLRVGDVIWTLGAGGSRVAAPLVAIGSTRAPFGHAVVVLALEDGRSVRVSPGHPLVDGRRVGELRSGDVLDGSVVRSISREPYAGETHDVLPAGPTAAYWGNGVLLASSLRTAAARPDFLALQIEFTPRCIGGARADSSSRR